MYLKEHIKDARSHECQNRTWGLQTTGHWVVSFIFDDNSTSPPHQELLQLLCGCTNLKTSCSFLQACHPNSATSVFVSLVFSVLQKHGACHYERKIFLFAHFSYFSFVWLSSHCSLTMSLHNFSMHISFCLPYQIFYHASFLFLTHSHHTLLNHFSADYCEICKESFSLECPVGFCVDWADSLGTYIHITLRRVLEIWFLNSVHSKFRNATEWWWRSCLRHCATSLKVTGPIPYGVNGLYHWHNPSGSTMALGLTQTLTEMSTRDISWGVKAAGA